MDGNIDETDATSWTLRNPRTVRTYSQGMMVLSCVKHTLTVHHTMVNTHLTTLVICPFLTEPDMDARLSPESFWICDCTRV